MSDVANKCGLSRTHLATLFGKTEKGFEDDYKPSSPFSEQITLTMENPSKLLDLLVKRGSLLPPNVEKRAREKLNQMIVSNVSTVIPGKVFIKQVKSNELGFRNGKPNQAGSFILIPKNCLDIFPMLSDKVVNDSRSIKVVIEPEHEERTCEYVYHNSKFAENEENGRDEYRLYNSNTINDKIFLKPDNIIVIAYNKMGAKYYMYRYDSSNSEYNALLELVRRHKETRSDSCLLPIAALLLENIKLSKLQLLDQIAYDTDDDSDSYETLDEQGISDQTSDKEDILSEKLMKFLEGQELKEDVNYTVAQIKKIKRDARFRKAVLMCYDNKCAITKDSISYQYFSNIQACHIMAKSVGGSDNPSNGIALDMNFHWAFDKGMFTIMDDYAVNVHPAMKINPLLSKYDGQKIMLPNDSKYYPSKDALRYHRENVYGEFLK